jgi:hypothetical protein
MIVAPPLIQGPPRTRTPTQITFTSSRRSERTAVQPREADIIKQPQRVLVNKLELEAPSPNIASDTMRKYKTGFWEPVADPGIKTCGASQQKLWDQTIYATVKLH